MPQLAPIVINDGAATPVAHTFSPVTTDGFLAVSKERVGVPVGYPSLEETVRPPVKGGEVYKLKTVLKIPVVANVDGSSVVVRTAQGTVEMLFHESSSEQERKDLRVMLANYLGNATTIQVIEKLEPKY